MTLTPFGDRVVFKRFAAKAKTKEGLILPEQGRRAPDRGKVLAVGGDVKNVKSGDSIHYAPYAVFWFEEQDVQFGVIREKDIVGLVPGDEE